MKQKGESTLLASVLLSSPGPLVLGIALFFGRSSTQIADFVSRTAELRAIVVSWIVFRLIHKDADPDPERKLTLENIANLCVGTAMCLSGAAMLLIAFLSLESEKGNVIPALIIAFLGVVTNSFFWLRYRRLDREQPNTILSVQSRLYLAKSIVDTCVVISLAFVAFAPASLLTGYVDLGGSVVVALYLIISGAGAIRERKKIEAKHT